MVLPTQLQHVGGLVMTAGRELWLYWRWKRGPFTPPLRATSLCCERRHVLQGPVQMCCLPGSLCWLSAPCSFGVIPVLILPFWALSILHWSGLGLGQDSPPDCKSIQGERWLKPIATLAFSEREAACVGALSGFSVPGSFWEARLELRREVTLVWYSFPLHSLVP